MATPTYYTDQFYQIDPYNAPPAGTQLTVEALQVTDNSNGVLQAGDYTYYQGHRVYDSINGERITAVYNGDTVTVEKGGVQTTITGVTFYTADGHQYWTPTSADHIDNATLVTTSWVPDSTYATVGGSNSDLGPPCFVAGTLIATAEGAWPVEALEPGDLVETLDHGLQALHWTGQRVVAGRGDFAPIRIAAGALGNARDLYVSPQHRMLVTGWRAELFFGASEVLVAAKHLVDDRAIRPAPCSQVTYCHLMFDRHEVVRAEGAWSESFHPGDWMLQEDAGLRTEVTALFPELGQAGRGWDTARTVLRRREARVMREAC
jgi:hypothetical protein